MREFSMKFHNTLLIGVFILLTMLVAVCTDIIYVNIENHNIENVTELVLTAVPAKTELNNGESCTVYLTLTNIGNKTLNVWKMEHQISYDVSFVSSTDNRPAFYQCGVIERVLLTNEFLVGLKPGESLNSTINSGCWQLNPGEYKLNAVYHAGEREKITKSYWKGYVTSNEVLIKVRNTQNNLTAPPL